MRIVWLLALALAASCGDDGPAPPATGMDVVSSDADAESTGDAAGGDSAASDTASEDGTEPPPPPFTIGEGDWVGIAVVDITPTIAETFEDLNGNAEFDGCRDDPDASEEGCDEPFDDANGNGVFDAVFIAGYGPLRPALEVHDPIEARAIVLARGDEYVAFVSLDLVGIGVDRIDPAREALALKGWDPDRIIVASAHNHAGPDVRGLWGNPDPEDLWPGADPAYNASVTAAIEQVVEMAADGLQPVTVVMGTTRMRDRSEWFNGRHFGGRNPTDKMHGLIHDIRDPVVVSDQVFALHARAAGGEPVATLVNFSAHPELLGDKQNALSADWVGYTRARVEAELGGLALVLPECLGGMQSGLGGHTPLVNEQGEWVMEEIDGEMVPVWAPPESFHLARSYGYHVADAAMAIVAGAEPVALEPFEVEAIPFYVPIDNGSFQLLYALGLFDADPDLAIKDPALCPEYNPDALLHPGCSPDLSWRVRLGPAELITAPGELLPEVFWGVPSADPRWELESTTASARGSTDGRDSAFFPQHPPACDTVDFLACLETVEAIDGCDCLRYHDIPYRISLDPAVPPLIELLEDEHRFVVGMAGDYLGYMVPESDFNRAVSLLDGPVGDHYEESVSASYRFATKLQAIHQARARRRP